MIELRLYQSTIIDQAREAMRRGVRSMVIESPTGSGKTALTAMMVKTAADKGMTCWFIMHRAELLRQAMRAFQSVEVDVGLISPAFTPQPQRLVQLALIGTLRRRLAHMRPPNLIIYDESHHVAAKSWADIHAAFPQAFHIGLTATPERLDGKGLGSFFKEMIKGPEVRWLIDNGYLSDYRLVIPPGGVDAEGIHRTMGDFNKQELAEAADKPTITGNAVREYLKYAKGKRAIARHVNIELSKRLAADFVANGIPAIHVDGDTPQAERHEAMESFTRGETLVLTNVDLFSEGVDVPAVECVLDLRPTQSLTLWLQFCGRALRPAPGKTKAIIIDMGGNFKRHGLPCEVRDWDLAGRKKRSGNGGPAIVTTTCPKCYAVMMGRPVECTECDHVFEVGGGREVDHVDGELVELNVEQARTEKLVKIQKWREIGAARTFEDFQALAKKYKYKPGWAWFRFNARQAKAAIIK